MPNTYYTLTLAAEDDFRAARRWSNRRWGKELTQQYFKDLHKAAKNAAKQPTTISRKSHLANIKGLEIAVVREHYLVCVPSSDAHIIIVALLRQTQDVPAILEANSFIIQRDVKDVLEVMKSQNKV